MQLFKKKITCPNCKQQLEKAPTRKTQCPHCKQTILVRKGELLTIEDTEIYDWVDRLEGYGITKQQIVSEREKLSKRFKLKASINDTIWSIFNAWIVAHPNEEQTWNIYYEMARLVCIEGKRDPKPLIESALRSRLLYLKSQGIKQVQIYAYGGRGEDANCDQCAKMHGKKLKIEEALEKMPIPRNCTSEEGCRCYYDEVYKDI